MSKPALKALRIDYHPIVTPAAPLANVETREKAGKRGKFREFPGGLRSAISWRAMIPWATPRLLGYFPRYLWTNSGDGKV